MISGFGVEHVAKGALPKIPAKRLIFATEPDAGNQVLITAHKKGLLTRRPKHLGSLEVDPNPMRVNPDGLEVGYIQTRRRYRRRGVATNLMQHGEKVLGKPLVHSQYRTALGEKFAQGESAKRGTRPVRNRGVY